MRRSISSDIVFEISRADRASEAPPLQLQLDGLEQVVRLVGDFEVSVPRDAESGALGDLHLREERGQRVRDHVLEWEIELLFADADEAGQELRHLDAGEALLARLRVADEDAERQRERRDVGKRLAGADRERG
jgi:hypothetical protein